MIIDKVLDRPTVETVRDLGVIVDHRLKFDAHISRDRIYVRGHSARTCTRDTAVAQDLPARPSTPLWNRIAVRRHPATTSRP